MAGFVVCRIENGKAAHLPGQNATGPRAIGGKGGRYTRRPERQRQRQRTLRTTREGRGTRKGNINGKGLREKCEDQGGDHGEK